MNLTDMIAELQKAYSKGVEIGQEQSELRRKQRKVIAALLKKERTARGWTQEEISEKIKANVLTYRGYENEKSDIPIFYLRRLADVYGATMDYMIGRDSEQTSVATVDALNKRLEKLESQMRELTQQEPAGEPNEQ